jgi:hypothetical protein
VTIVRDVSAQAARAQLRGGAVESAQQEASAAKAAVAEALRAAHLERDAALVRAGAADRRAAQLEQELGEAKVRCPLAGACCPARSCRIRSDASWAARPVLCSAVMAGQA